MARIDFHICLGVQGPIRPGSYWVRDKTITVEYIERFGRLRFPKHLSTAFTVSWNDQDGRTEAQLRSSDFRRTLPVHEVLAVISEFLLAFKLEAVDQIFGYGVRTVGIADSLARFCTIDGDPVGSLNIGIKDYGVSGVVDPSGITDKALKHLDGTTLPLARRFARCFELFEHGFFQECFIVSFSILDDVVQEMLQAKGATKKQLSGVRGRRLRTFLGSLMKMTCGRDIASIWAKAEDAIDWLNGIRNGIAHDGDAVDRADAAFGMYGCMKLLSALHADGLPVPEIPDYFMKHARTTAEWNYDVPDWVRT